MIPIRIPLLVPELPNADALMPYLRRIDSARWYSNFGPLLCEFEERIAGAFQGLGGAPLHLTSVSNATLGLELALSALDLQPGSKVLIPALTFVATATSVQRMGFLPVVGDIDALTWVLTPEIAEHCVAGSDIAAVIPVATFGMPLDTLAWDRFTDKTGVPVVIDAAAAFGNHQTIGRALTVFSLHATKPLSSGEGGIILSTDRSAIKRIRRLSNFGINLADAGNVAVGFVAEVGTNAKMSEYHAAIGLASLAQWQQTSRRRLELARQYIDSIGVLGLSEIVKLQEGSESVVRSTFCVSLTSNDVCNTVIRALESAGIAFRMWYRPLIPDHPAFSAINDSADIPTARALSERMLGLPFYPSLGREQVEEVCNVIAAGVR